HNLAGARAVLPCRSDRAAPGEGPEGVGTFTGVTLFLHDIHTVDDLPVAFDAGVRERVQGLLTTAESIFRLHRARVTELAARYRLPAVYPYAAFARDSAGLMAYEVNDSDLHKRAAGYVDKLLKGAKPSELVVQQPTKFELVINTKTAKALGLTIPQSLLTRA